MIETFLETKFNFFTYLTIQVNILSLNNRYQLGYNDHCRNAPHSCSHSCSAKCCLMIYLQILTDILSELFLGLEVVCMVVYVLYKLRKMTASQG